MKLLKLINPRNVSEEVAATYKLRTAARIVVQDDENNIALLKVGRDGYYKLPGGGIDEGEDMMDGLQRECHEEIGCDVKVLGEIGLTIEYWKEDNEKQTSYCYFGKVVGKKGIPGYTEQEKERNFSVVWVSYLEAINLFNQSSPKQFEGEYIKPRDLSFLKKAKKYLSV
ncbi:MAG: NUDIX domain-containing protein [Candidatus Pacebacteria bacterium]|nr:NUDIX domain-containing protein [Candidatus Paceibacterota bacterium]